VLTVVGRKAFSPTDHVGSTTADLAIVQIQGGDFIAIDYTLERFADLTD
jgi:hypothetical protein